MVIIALTIGPLMIIWALNTLFGFVIAYTFKTWLATLILAGVFHHSSSRGK